MIEKFYQFFLGEFENGDECEAVVSWYNKKEEEYSCKKVPTNTTKEEIEKSIQRYRSEMFFLKYDTWMEDFNIEIKNELLKIIEKIVKNLQQELLRKEIFE